MPEKSIKTDLYECLADILSTTKEERTALKAFRAMRALNPKGALFLVTPLLVDGTENKVRLSDAVAAQIYRELDRGLPYSRVASNLRISARRVRKLQAVWNSLPEWLRDQHRREWTRQSKRQNNVLEIGRDAGNRRVLLRRTSVAE